jgi:hypothetical protein
VSRLNLHLSNIDKPILFGIQRIFCTYGDNWTTNIETFTLVDQFPSVRPPSKFSNNNICSSKQTTSVQIDHIKYQITNRSTSLPSRQTFSSNQNIKENVRQRRRHVSDSNNNNKTRTTSLVTSFIQYLRCELRAATNDQKHDHSRIHKKVS